MLVFAALCCKVEFHDYFRLFSDQLLKNCQEFLADLKILAPKYFPRIILGWQIPWTGPPSEGSFS